MLKEYGSDCKLLFIKNGRSKYSTNEHVLENQITKRMVYCIATLKKSKGKHKSSFLQIDNQFKTKD